MHRLIESFHNFKFLKKSSSSSNRNDSSNNNNSNNSNSNNDMNFYLNRFDLII
jgi:hypothetical protein